MDALVGIQISTDLWCSPRSSHLTVTASPTSNVTPSSPFVRSTCTTVPPAATTSGCSVPSMSIWNTGNRSSLPIVWMVRGVW